MVGVSGDVASPGLGIPKEDYGAVENSDHDGDQGQNRLDSVPLVLEVLKQLHCLQVQDSR